MGKFDKVKNYGYRVKSNSLNRYAKIKGSYRYRKLAKAQAKERQLNIQREEDADLGFKQVTRKQRLKVGQTVRTPSGRLFTIEKINKNSIITTNGFAIPKSKLDMLEITIPRTSKSKNVINFARKRFEI